MALIVATEKASATYQRELACVLQEEIFPLLVRHKEEIAHYPDIELDPDWDWYRVADATGSLRCYTARIDGQLVGYFICFVQPNRHYKKSLQANQDVLFVVPEHRGSLVGYGLIRHAYRELKREGVQVVYQRSKAKRNEGRLFERMGHELIDQVYAIRLDKE